jgi:hypothetical protein
MRYAHTVLVENTANFQILEVKKTEREKVFCAIFYQFYAYFGANVVYFFIVQKEYVKKSWNV